MKVNFKFKRSKLPITFGLVFLGFYIVVSQVLMPILSPLRGLGELEPALLRNMMLPPLFLFIILFSGTRNILKIRTGFHIIIIIIIAIACLNGLSNLSDGGSIRSYLSHLFQLASAYVMINFGWILKDEIPIKFWRYLVGLALISTLISTAFTLSALERGDLGRLYTPAYTFIFVAAYSVIYSSGMSALTIFGMLVSNKRGPILSVISVFLIYLVSGKKWTRSQLVKVIFKGAGAGGICFILMVLLVNWAKDPENENTGVGRAITITLGRIDEIADMSGSDRSLDAISSGRLYEAEITLEDLNGMDYVFGSGAGWRIFLPDGKPIQNIHFTPLSVTAVFGFPFALYLYLYLIVLIFKANLSFKNREQYIITERIAPLYLTGAVLHSLFAYSLFIDWLVFFFVGVLMSSQKKRSKKL